MVISAVKRTAVSALILPVLMALFSCSSTEKLVQEEFLTGVHEFRPSGLTAKTYSFSSCTISEVESGKAAVSDSDSTLKTQDISYIMNDGNGGIWSAEGRAELRTLSPSSDTPEGSSLSYSFQLAEQGSGRRITIDIIYDPEASGFNGFMSGKVTENEVIYRIYSSRNLNFYDIPSEGLDGFTIREGHEILTTLIKSNGHWAVIYNFEDTYARQEEMNAVVSALFIILEKGRIK